MANPTVVAAVKGGLGRDEALAAGFRIARKVAARRPAHLREDAESAAFEAVCLAWQSWNPAGGRSWTSWARQYAIGYSGREVQKYFSIVQTDYSRAKGKQSDHALVIQDPDGGGCVCADVRDDSFRPDRAAETREELEAVAALFESAVEALSPTQRKIGEDVIRHRLARPGDEAQTVQQIADRHGVSKQYASKIESLLRAQIAEMV